jgi:hypothetical protein
MLYSLPTEFRPAHLPRTGGIEMITTLFQTAGGISTLIGLLAFVAAAVLVWQLNNTREKNKQLSLLPKEQRAQVVDDWLTRYGVDAKNMPEKKKFELIQEEMKRRYNLKVTYLVVLTVAAVICFAIAAWIQFQKESPKTPPADPKAAAADTKVGPAAAGSASATPLSTVLADLARDKVQLHCDDSDDSERDYLGIAALELSEDRKTVHVALDPRGKYLKENDCWTDAELKNKLISELNRAKTKSTNEDLRALNITHVDLIQPESSHGRAPGRPKFVGDPKVPLRQHPRDSEIRYFVDRLDHLQGIDEATAIQAVLRAVDSWNKVIHIFERVSTKNDANLVIGTTTLPPDSSQLALTDSGPPAGFQLRLQLNEGKIWTDTSLEGVTCHQLGHALGLHHSDRSDQVMHGIFLGVLAPRDEDIALVRQLWPVPSAPQAAPKPAAGASQSSPANSEVIAEKIKKMLAKDATPLSQPQLEETLRILLSRKLVSPEDATEAQADHDKLLKLVEEAVKKLQRAEGQKADGILGPETLKWLKESQK